MTATAWSRVTKGAPCPVCGHDSWCTVSPGGASVRCKRAESDEPVEGQDGQAWLHRLDGGERRANVRAVPPEAASRDSEWRARAASFAAAITPAQVETLARQLGVPASILRDLGIGWDGGAWTFPMYAADGSVCGVRRRPTKGKKHCIKGSKLGVFRRLKPEDGLLLITEGESDAAAAMTLGFDAIGVPGASQCSDVAAAYASGRAVVIVVDLDDAGTRGAETLVAATSSVAASVCVLRPPSGHKDMRAWVNAGATRADVEGAIACAPALTPPAEAPPPWRGRRRRQGQKLLPLGSRDPESTKLVLSTAKTLPTAQAYVRENEWHEGVATLHHYAGSFMRWCGNRWTDVEEGALAQHLHQILHDDAVHYVLDKKTGAYVLVNFDANPSTVRQAIDTLRNHCFLASSTVIPSWFGGAPPFPLRELLACATRTLHIPTGQTIAPTPAFFTTAALDFDYDPGAPECLRWLAFLRDLFGDDDEQIRLLQEWFGYALTADTSQQKILLIVGPRRSGKGTIARVLTRLVGAANVVGPTVSGLAGSFGLQPLLGKSLAIVSDARFAGENIMTVVERLLCISGEDTITVDRKHVTSVTVRLPTRFVFLTNELPRLSDASTALAGRFSILRLERSFYGNENVDLLDALLAELPGILLWSLLGWHRLREQRRFTEPTSTRHAVQDIEDLSSPVAAFVRDRCVVGVTQSVLCADLYAAWTCWCTAEGRTTPSTQQVFGRDLAAAVPTVRRRRSTGGTLPRYEGVGLAGVTQ